MTLGAQLDNARYVRHVKKWNLTLAWFGSNVVHGYNSLGQEVATWTIDGKKDVASLEEVIDSMNSHIENNYFPD